MAAATYPPEPTPSQVAHLVSAVKDWSIAHGLAVRPPPVLVREDADPSGVLATTAPVTLFPSPFPRACFEQALSIQNAYNELYACIASDEEFLKAIVEEILEVDDYIAELWKVHLKVKKEGYTQNLCLGLFRSDYMVHQALEDSNSTPLIKQVEFNTIAASFGGLSSQTTGLHKYLAKSCYPDMVVGRELAAMWTMSMPQNTSAKSLANGIRHAFNAYERQSPEIEACVLFLVQTPERNIFDQRHIQYELEMEDPGIPVFRLAFSEILAHTTVSSAVKRQLLYRPPHNPSKLYEAAVVYLRSGYGPQDYPDASAWEARLQIERSYAIKCPSVLTQLAGAKKVQQVLTTPSPASSPSILKKFVKDDKARSELEKTFTNIFPLDDTPAGLEARKIALDSELSKGYVLKPQREGGGNNIYRSAIPPFLKSLPESYWKSYILMEIITPPPVRNLILRNGNVEKGGVICELGIYGTCIWNQSTKDILHNEEAGYLLRTKGDKSEEGGVAAGFGSMDSCLLF